MPHDGIEEMIGQPVHWLARNKVYTWDGLGLSTPDHFIHTGWAYPAFNSLGAEVKRQMGRRYGMIDTIWYGTVRQWIGMVIFRAIYRRWFDGVLVPGKRGRHFCRRMGMPNAQIQEGLYGANPEIFSPGKPLHERPKRVLFVGRFIERKGVKTLIEAARLSCKRGDGWEFRCIGSGPLQKVLEEEGFITIRPFGSPEFVAEEMGQARFLVLPSVEENWGVVLHEAALCGMGLICAKGVGAASDLLEDENGRQVDRGDANHLANVLHEVSTWNPQQLRACTEKSLRLAASFGPEVFKKSVLKMCRHA